MVGFGSLGGLGGRPGGFGASFPTRGGAPNSQTVDYLGPQEEWQADFNSRWQAEARKAAAAVMRSPAGRPDAPTGDPNWTDSTGISTGWGVGVDPIQEIMANRDKYNASAIVPTYGWTMTSGADPNYHPTAPTPTWGLTTEINGYQGQSGPGTPPRIVNDVWDPGYTPDFSALEQERKQMLARYDAQGRNQQAYDWMLGGGQINGIIGPEYTNPNFGQIGAQTPEVPEGTDMAWAADVYRPGDTFTAPRPTSKGWNFW
jgi:hypothetical protein